MKKICLFAMVATVAASAFAFEVPPALFKTNSIVLFQGDSITHGGRLRDMNHFMGHGYQAEIAMRYLAYRPNDGLQFGNRGVSGHTSSNLVERWSRDAFPYTADEGGYRGQFNVKNKVLTPDYLSILIGVNDHGRRKRNWFVPAKDYEKNLHFMVTNSLSVNPNLKIIICEPFRLPEYTGKDVCFKEYQQAARRVAEQYNLVFVPFQKLFSEDLLAINPRAKYWSWDSIHPTYAAHMKMADFWIETVEKEFAKGKGSPKK